jgi:hypothetical protein
MRGSRLVCVALLAASTAVTSADAKTVPTLRLMDMQPVVLRGIAFKPLERVRVTINVDGDLHARTVRTTRGGSFVAGFSAVPRLDPCESVLIATARGAKGDKAVMMVGKRLCPPPP